MNYSTTYPFQQVIFSSSTISRGDDDGSNDGGGDGGSNGGSNGLGAKLFLQKFTLPKEEIFRPEFGDRYMLEVIVADNKENDVMEIVRKNSKIGKIFISPLTRAIDIESGVESDRAI